MKKVFIFCAFLLTTHALFASYTIKIAVYKDEVNLMRFIAKIPQPQYRKNIRIEEKNHLHYVTSVEYEYEKEVTKALQAYKKVFPDAFVEEVEDTHHIVSPKKEVISVPSPMEDMPLVSIEAKKLLENKMVYLCKEKYSEHGANEIIKLDFHSGYLLYSKHHRDIPPLKIPYTFDKDSVILTMSGISFKYKILKEEETFLSVQGFVNNKKGQKFRYYFDEALALDFAKNLKP